MPYRCNLCATLATISGSAFFTACCTVLLLVVPQACCWSCDFAVIGEQTGSTFVKNDVLKDTRLVCSKDPGDTGIVNITVDPSLSRFTDKFRGVQWQIQAGTESLVRFDQAANITFLQAQLQQVGTHQPYVVQFVASQNITFDELRSQQCACNASILSFANSSSSPGDKSGIVVIKSSFQSSLAGAMDIRNSSASVTATNFTNLRTYPFSAITVQSGSAFHMFGCLLQNNTGWPSDGGFWNGSWGTVNVTAAQTIIDASYFSNNTYASGGAIYAFSGANKTVVNITRCTFENNSAGNDGGALLLQGSQGLAGEQYSIVNSTFNNNQAQNRGGALNTWGVANVYINASNFTGSTIYMYGFLKRYTNVIIENAIVEFPHGDDIVVYLYLCACVGIANSTFRNSVGIAVKIHVGGGSCEDSMPIKTRLFDRSTIGRDEQSNATLSKFLLTGVEAQLNVDIRDSVFGNVAPHFSSTPGMFVPDGALVILEVPRVAICNSTFVSNVGQLGAGLYMDAVWGGALLYNNFSNNVAVREGGAVAMVSSHGNGLLMLNNLVVNNSALSGGGVYGSPGTQIIVNGSRSVFADNKAGSKGGAIYADNAFQLQLSSATLQSNEAGEAGGGIYCGSCMLISVLDSQLISNSAGQGGALFVGGDEGTLTNVTRSTFAANWAGQLNNKTGGDGGAVYLAGGSTWLSGNIYSGNNASARGGALAYMHACFQAASTPGVVGTSNALQWAWEFPKLAAYTGNCSFLASQGDTFLHNFASDAGAVLFSTNMSTTKISCFPYQDNATLSFARNISSAACDTWHGNSVGDVGYGNSTAFVPAKLIVEMPDITRYVSNGSNTLGFTAKVLDEAGTQVTLGTSNLQPLRVAVGVEAANDIATSSGPLLVGQDQATANSIGDFNVSNLILEATPGPYILNVSLLDQPQVPVYHQTVIVRQCIMGEISPRTNAHAGTICSTCLPSSYSFTPGGENCTSPCPGQATCHGGATLVPLEGFWHSAATSDAVVACPNPAACKGSRDQLLACQQATYAQQQASCQLDVPVNSKDANGYMFQQCSPGYYGAVCSLCVRDGPQQYGRTGSLQCQPCQSPARIICAFTASNVLVIAFLTYLIHTTLAENEEDFRHGHQTVQPSELLKAFQLWLQYTTLLGSVNVDLPKTVRWIPSAASFAFSSVTSGALSTDCLLDPASTSMALQRLLLRLAVLPLVLLLLAALQVVWWFKDQRQASFNSRRTAAAAAAANSIPGTSRGTALSRPAAAALGSKLGVAALQRRLLITLLTAVFYFYPSLLTSILSLFACYHLDDRSTNAAAYIGNAQAKWHWGYWLPDMSVKCFTGWHLKLSLGMGIPLTLLACIGIPVLPTCLLFKYRKHLHTSPAVQANFGFLYCHYRPSCWFWDSMVLLQTLAVSVALVFATALNAFYQLTIALMVFVVGVIILAQLQPFEARLSQKIQVLSLSTVVTTNIGILYFLDASKVASAHGLEAVGVLLLLLNVAVVALMLALVMWAARHSIKSWIQWGCLRAKAVWPPSRSRRKQHAPTSTASSGQQQHVALVTGPSSSSSSPVH